MADKKQLEASKIDALYSWLSYDIQKMKAEIMKEMKYSSVQFSSLYQSLQAEKDKSSQAISQEIRYSYKQNQTIYDGLAHMLTHQVSDRLNAMSEATSAVQEKQEALDAGVADILAQVSTLTEEGSLVEKLGLLEEKLAVLESLEALLAEINGRVASIENNDYQALVESVGEKAEASVAEHSRQVLNALENFVIPENVDYNRIVDEVGDKVLELFNEVGLNEPASEPVEAKIDYELIVDRTAEKVVESLPVYEKVDYNFLQDSIQKAVDGALEKALAALNVDALANAVAAKVQAPAVDYDKLADMVAEKLAANSEQTYDVVLDEAGIAQIADKVSEKLSAQQPTYELVVDEEGVQAIAKSVSEELAQMGVPCVECVQEQPVVETTEEIVEEVVEEALQEEPVEEVVAEATEETVEEVTEEVAQEEPVAEEVVEEVAAETPSQPAEELAVAEEQSIYDELTDQLVDAETGLVIRLKKSFTAKMKQSEDKVKEYYSDLKNELVSYKRINSNISWHGDRFNFGRETVAKVNICGKTLCFYIALDPDDPEYKSTVYHQKNVGNQKAYESTPFMVKIKSDAAAKKALRLVGYLAEKLGTAKDEDYKQVNYADEFPYETTKQLFDAGFIKATKEKKVELDF